MVALAQQAAVAAFRSAVQLHTQQQQQKLLVS